MPKIKRPEYAGPPENFYDERESIKYSNSSRIIQIQTEMSERAIELLSLAKPSFILDIGCGSGLSGAVLTEAGHNWIGMDISQNMLDVAKERGVEGDLILSDMGDGIPFKPGTFDGVISISALQWLCCSNRKDESTHKRLYKFFMTLYSSLKRNARAVFQIYPDSDTQMELITKSAMKAGFTGGLVIDYPNSKKAKKIYLCLSAGTNLTFKLPMPKTKFSSKHKKQTKNLGEMPNYDMDNSSNKSSANEMNDDMNVDSNNSVIDSQESSESEEDSGAKPKCILANKWTKNKNKHLRKHKNNKKHDKSWIQAKKLVWMKRGKKVARDSKYSGRKRKHKF